VRFITASANHAIQGISTYPFAVFAPDLMPRWMEQFAGLPNTVVGHDCWIGHGAMLLPGVRLGHGVIVGAGAVVARDVPDYHVVAGNPARVIRPRFTQDVVARLLRLAWWDWPVARIEAAVPLLVAGNVAGLESMG
jgi:virginiamycin A acetyltransferase